MDFRVQIKQAPKIVSSDFPRSLTVDRQSVTCVACKTGNNWHSGLLSDASKPAPIDVVRSGGNFTMFVNRPLGAATERDPLVAEVTQQLAASADVQPSELYGRIFLFDATDIAASYAHHPFWPPPRVEQQLGIQRVHGIGRLDDWRSWLQFSRSLPTFVADDLRHDAIEQIGQILEPDDDHASRVVWILGPPGAGKSRLTLEALANQPPIDARIYAAEDFEYGRRAIYESELPAQPDIVLVIDECPANQAPGLAVSFHQKNANSRGTLLLIGPQEGATGASGFSINTVRVEPLDDKGAQRLVNQELGGSPADDPGLVGRVLNLSEGYPWFAVLLARALRDDPNALPSGSDHWRAAALAIAGPERDYGGDYSRWSAEVDARARALLAAILTEGDDWSSLSPEEQDSLGNAVGQKWPDVQRLANLCWERGILRVRQNWRYKYVTPNNLARMVATRLLQAPYYLGSQIRTHVPALCETLYRRLEVLEVSESLLQELAHHDLRSLEEHSDPFDLGPRQAALQFLAHWQPARTARWLREAVESKTLDQLRARTDVRRDLVFALAHITHRREGFEDAEAALFYLALAENEAWSNNATGIWAGLFFAALNLTHRSFDARFAILMDRATQGPCESRILAISGLANATSRESAGPGYTSADMIDGAWPVPTIGEVSSAKARAWELLADLTTDEDALVAEKARHVALQNLRAAIRWGIGRDVLDLLGGKASQWPQTDLADLREALNDIRRYEGEALNQDDDLKAAVEDLFGQVRPSGFHDRLLDVVGRWFPGDQPIGSEDFESYQAQLDVKLAEDGLAPPIPLRDELEWLDSEEAVRNVPFMMHVGQLDTEALLLEALVERAMSRGAANTLSAYLQGLAQAGMEDKVDAALRSWRGKSELALHTFLTVLRVGPTDERLAWVVEDLRTGALDPNATGGLALGSWGARASSDSARQLIETLAGFPDVIPRITALRLIVERSSHPEEMDRLEGPLADLLVDLAAVSLGSMNDYVWEWAAKIALQRGLVETVVEAAIAAIGSRERFGTDDRAWDLIRYAAEVEPLKTWEGLAPLLEQKGSDFYRVLLEARHHQILSAMPVSMIMDWVGSQERRGLLIAGMCSVHEAPLNEHARRLIIKFGPQSAVARELAALAHSTPTAVSSFSRFAKLQMENAQQWRQDGEPSVAEWGQLRFKEFSDTFEAESAREEFERRER